MLASTTLSNQHRDEDWYFDNSSANESRLKPLCQRAEKLFQLPSRRLYRYFAAAEDPDLPRLIGPYYRGFHIPLSGRNDLPEYLSDCFFRPVDEFELKQSFEQIVAFDNLIYIRHSTCSDVVGCVATYAHELQHFMQHGHTPKLWAVNSLLYDNLGKFDPTATPIDVPHERDANIASKRVGEIVCGVEAVQSFANEQIRLMELEGNVAQVTRWKFFRDAPASTDYNLLEETTPLIEKYKDLINFHMDVNRPDWWQGALDHVGRF